jgi:hypothetical protein
MAGDAGRGREAFYGREKQGSKSSQSDTIRVRVRRDRIVDDSFLQLND